MNGVARGHKWRVWFGIIGGPIAWAVHHQLGSDLNYTDCLVGDSTLVVLTGAAALCIAVASGAIAWSALRDGGPDESNLYGRFLPLLGLMGSGLFALTIALQIGAGAVVPSCAQ
jgi:hypothetical protein